MKVKHFHDKIINYSNIEDLIRENRKGKKIIVSTNGCFDILHHGHIDYLQKSSDLGDILIVGINSDISVRKLKGEKRPINPESSRAAVISSLGFVDYCVIFPEDTPIELLKKIKPDIHIKGGDYRAEDIPEKKVVEENGGIVKILPLFQGFSTTNIIDKLQNYNE